MYNNLIKIKMGLYQMIQNPITFDSPHCMWTLLARPGGFPALRASSQTLMGCICHPHVVIPFVEPGIWEIVGAKEDPRAVQGGSPRSGVAEGIKKKDFPETGSPFCFYGVKRIYFMGVVCLLL